MGKEDGDAEWLAKRILAFEMTKPNVVSEIQKSRRSVKEIAFQTIIKNRTFHGVYWLLGRVS